ncbi:MULTISPECIES: AAA family ATPase [unclassified Frondihabitans]|uniref:AAA family ATPase n=1 Tax=unclassified Frondihabitans TaxID=2626248 RepID=UPI000F4EC3C8|nr:MULTISPECIES: AAA family ATPase [unclassified Frondihabitans]RPE78251.1 exonuclease SbcC [Frondihabitans sp. PhB153]RPF08532.1 exonuclease SbcC [Frondihabitans sp. PhB161]
MELHRLTLRAIGPYADEFTIDFAALRSSGVFLLEGPTGSGKSTIIDAIVFALYGGLAGASSSDDRLRSHHAGPSVEPFVELVFETGTGIHLIRRSPKWNRPKSRGVGTTPVNMSVVLQRLATPGAVDGETLSTRAQEVGGEIPRILGVTKEQFLQTIVLPQGEFARFLAASGEERRLVLQSLFGTEIYDRTTATLVDARRAANAAVESSQRAVDEALAGLRSTVDVGADQGPGDGPRVEEDAGLGGDGGTGSPVETVSIDVENAAEVVARLSAESGSASERRDIARAALDDASAKSAEVMKLAEAIEARRGLMARREALSGRVAAVAEARNRTELADRAALVEGPARALSLSEAKRERARDELAVLRGSIDDSLFEAELDDLRDRRERLAHERATLAAIVELEVGLPARDDEQLRTRGRLADRRSAIAAGETGVTAQAAEREGLTAEIAAAAELAGTLDLETRRLDDLHAALEAVRRHAELAGASQIARESVSAAAARAREAVDTEADLRRRRISGVAGELALELIDGEPCSVCGATEHPAPAVLLDGHPTDRELDEATRAREVAEAALQTARDEASALEARLGDAARAVGDHDGDELRVHLTEVEAKIGAARAAVLERSKADDRLLRFDAETAAQEAAIAVERLDLAAEEARLETEAERLVADRSRVAEILAGRAASCVALSDELHADERVLVTIVRAREAEAAAAVEVESRRADVELALASSTFESVAEASAALLAPGDRAVLLAEIRDFDNESAVVADGLASPRVAALAGDEVADIEAAEAALAVASAAHAAAADRASRLEDRAASSERALGRLQQALRAADAVAEESRAIVRMADVASASGAENLHGVTLGTYVLLRRFDDVVAAANSRLGLMSSGRYQLEAAEREASSRARRAGLALTIRDNATGTTRDPKSFSGGETFYASLSLALGLADVVQAEAGGIELGTLFVDEGFGTLDPETLDAVMAELGALSAGGRVVGIVSHVDELKQRIADRIEVRRRPDGSSTLTSTAG